MEHRPTPRLVLFFRAPIRLVELGAGCGRPPHSRHPASIRQRSANKVVTALLVTRHHRADGVLAQPPDDPFRQAFYDAPAAEPSLLCFTNLLTKYLKPDLRDVGERTEIPASTRIISPLLEILQKELSPRSAGPSSLRVATT